MTDEDKKILRFRRPGDPEPAETPEAAAEAPEPVAEQLEEKLTEVDRMLIDALEHILEGAKRGEYSGIALLTMKKADRSFRRSVGMPEGATAEEQRLNGFAMLGALHMVEEDMKFLARQHYPTLAQIISEG